MTGDWRNSSRILLDLAKKRACPSSPDQEEDSCRSVVIDNLEVNAPKLVFPIVSKRNSSSRNRMLKVLFNPNSGRMQENNCDELQLKKIPTDVAQFYTQSPSSDNLHTPSIDKNDSTEEEETLEEESSIQNSYDSQVANDIQGVLQHPAMSGELRY
jgi:hypothetical protein